MNAPQPPDLEQLALSIRPEWAQAPSLGHLREALHSLRKTPHDVLAGPLIRCYRDPETRDPRRLAYRGQGCTWWMNPTVSPASRREAPYRPTEAEKAANAELARRKAAEIRANLAAQQAERGRTEGANA